VSGGCYFLVKVEVVFRKPIDDGVASWGGACRWGEWVLSPCVVGVHVPY